MTPTSAAVKAETAPAIALRDVSFSYGSSVVLEEVNLTVPRGEFLALLGPNGGGKTTLLRLLLGLIEPDRGTVEVLGARPSRRHRAIGYVPQYARFESDLPIRVEDVVLMGRLGKGAIFRRYGHTDREAAREALVKLELADLAGRQIGGLSGGQVQRVLIARALASEPQILLLDEPTASLDTHAGGSFWEVLDELARHITVIVVSHDIGAISQHVHSVACLNRKLYYHPGGKLTREVVEKVYGCPVELLAHGHPHRVLAQECPVHGHGAEDVTDA